MDRWHDLERLKSGDGISEDRLDAVQYSIGRALPADLMELYRHVNGFEGLVGSCYLAVFPIEELSDGHPLGLSERIPDLEALVVGSDGGGEWYVSIGSGTRPGLYRFPKVSVDVADLMFVAPTLLDFIDGCLA